MFIGSYLLQASCLANTSTVDAEFSAVVVALHFFLALVSLHVLYLQIMAMPYPTEKNASFSAQSILGKQIYLTRHCLEYQAIHQVLSAFSLVYPSLTAITHSMSMWVAGLGMFVTVQYWKLVKPNPGFIHECKIWQERGVQFEALNDLLHEPAFFIAAFDVLVAKNSDVLSESVSMMVTLEWVFVYTVFYIALIWTNHLMTGEWPYMFLNEFGINLRQWAFFACNQCGVLLGFVSTSWLLMQLNGVLR